jgi:hypothetical protein
MKAWKLMALTAVAHREKCSSGMSPNQWQLHTGVAEESNQLSMGLMQNYHSTQTAFLEDQG